MAEQILVIFKNISELNGYERNSRTHSPEQIEQIATSIQEYGWTNPVLIDEGNVIIAGHGRCAAAELLALELVPTITLTGLTDQQKRAYRIADNKLPLNAGWDDELLKLELSELIDEGFDISLTGFGPDEIGLLLTDPESGESNSDDPYTTKIDTPVYEPSENNPDVTELYDESKSQQLAENIRTASLPPEVEKFLLAAAERHTVFNFSKIADYYSHAPENIQALFEASALVIIDYRQAIEHGFVHMTKRLVEIVHGEEVGEDA
ncbi:transcriptional regulator [Salmonella enterica subsp. enterica serovar Kibi]|nr:transcriptional regulator [Salmonella enterica subsp. enterica serovar Kibi]